MVPVIEALLIKKFPPIFTRARQAEALGREYDRARADYLAQREKVELTKTALREAADQLRAEADTADRLRQALGRELLRDPSTLREYMPISVDLQTVAGQRRDAAERLEQMARGLTPEKLLKTIVTRPVERFITQTAPRMVGQELGRQVLPKVDPAVIQHIVDPRPMTVDRLIDVILTGNIEQLRLGGNLDINIDVDALIETIREQFKEELKRERAELKGKWRERLSELLEEKIQAAKRELGQDTEGDEERDERSGREPAGAEAFDVLAGAVTGTIMTKAVGDERPQSVGSIAMVITEEGVIGGNLEIEYEEEDEGESEEGVQYDALEALAAGRSGLRVTCEKFVGEIGAFDAGKEHYPFKAEGSATVEVLSDDGWSRPKAAQVTVEGTIRKGNLLAGTLKVEAGEFTWTAR